MFHTVLDFQQLRNESQAWPRFSKIDIVDCGEPHYLGLWCAEPPTLDSNPDGQPTNEHIVMIQEDSANSVRVLC